METIISIIVGFFAGIVGSLGLGGGAVLILYLTLFLSVEQPKAQGMNLLFFIPCAILSVIIYKKKGMLDTKLIKSTILYGVIGGIIGAILSSLIDPHLLKILFGIMLTIFGFRELFSK